MSALVLIPLLALLACGWVLVEAARLWEFGVRLLLHSREAERLAARTLAESDVKKATPGQRALYRCLKPQDAFARWVKDGKPQVPHSLATRMLMKGERPGVVMRRKALRASGSLGGAR